MNQIVNLFVDLFISGWLDVANASNLQDDVPLTDEDMRHFIKTLSYLSFYGKHQLCVLVMSEHFLQLHE